MIQVGLVGVLDAKVVDHECEANRARGMAPETWCDGSLCIAMLGETLDKQIMSKTTSLRQPIHTLGDAHVDEVVMRLCIELVVKTEGSWDERKRDAHVFFFFHRRVQVEVFNIDG